MPLTPDPAPESPRVVRVVLFEGFQALDATGPVEVFAGGNHFCGASTHRRPYEVELIAAATGPVSSESAICISATRSLQDIDPSSPCDTLIIPGGNGVHSAVKETGLVEWIRAAAEPARRIASVCSGTFLLAEAGLLGEWPVTTHWACADRLATEYPELTVDPDPIYTRNGRVWTSAGVTAGIDLALAMVEADLGAKVAQAIARHLVMFSRRPGGQSQFAPTVWADPAESEPIRSAQDYIAEEPAGDLSIAALAARVSMSDRNFSRVFTREVGDSPGRYVERIRIDAARRELEITSTGVDVVAKSCGFGSSETMRRAFIRRLGVAPSSYRERFAVAHDVRNN